MDGNTYNTIKIGTQIWMAETLKTTRLNDGTEIPQVSDSYIWSIFTTPGFCWYDYNSGNRDIYGALYNWYAVNTGALCPEGWHVPSVAEWNMLTGGPPQRAQ